MTKRYGGQSMIAPLRRVLVKRPDEAFAVGDPAKWHYTARPQLEIAQQEHDGLVADLRQAGAEVIYQDEFHPDYADAIFVFDPAWWSREPASYRKWHFSNSPSRKRSVRVSVALRFPVSQRGMPMNL